VAKGLYNVIIKILVKLRIINGQDSEGYSNNQTIQSPLFVEGNGNEGNNKGNGAQSDALLKQRRNSKKINE
jgi:hypothetical protein